MEQIAHGRLNSATLPVTSETSASVNKERQPLCQTHPIATLAMALGKTIEARASEALAIAASDVCSGMVIAETEARIADIDKNLEPLWSKIRSEPNGHSELEVARIAKICGLLREPFPDEKRLARRGLSLDRQIPIEPVALDLAVLAAFASDGAVSIAIVGDVSGIVEQKLAVLLSIEKYIIELANALGEEVRGLARLRNPGRRDAAIGRVKLLIGDIEEAGRSLAEEAATAAVLVATSSPVSIPPSADPKVRSPLPLYHGTSAKRLKQILEDGCLRGADPDYETISLTLDRNVAEYFACQAALRDLGAQPEAERSAMVLELDGRALIALFHELNAGEVDWHRELVCWDSIDQLDRVLIGSELVPPDRFADYLRLDRKAFMPTSEFKPDDALWIGRIILQNQAKSALKWWS